MLKAKDEGFEINLADAEIPDTFWSQSYSYDEWEEELSEDIDKLFEMIKDYILKELQHV